MSLYTDVNSDFERILVETGPGEQLREFERRMLEYNMTMDGKLFPTFLKPYFVDQKHRKEIAYATEMMYQGLEAVGRAYSAGYDFKGLIHFEGRIAELCAIDPLYPNYQVMVRLDVFFDPDTGTTKFLEFNCGDPSGMGWHDSMLDMFMDMKSVKELGRIYKLRCDYLLPSHYEAFMRKYAEYCGRKGAKAKNKITFAAVCKRDSTIRGDFDLFVKYYGEKGHRALFADPRDFAYDGKRLSARGIEVDAIYRDAIEDIIFDPYWKDCRNLVSALKDGNVCFVNPARAATGEFKTILALMTDERHASIFPEEVRAAAKKYVPWTRLVRHETTGYSGEKVDLVPFVKAEKDRFVLKPNCGFGGFGILLGFETDADKWEKAVDSAAGPGGDFAVQELLDIPKEKFPAMNPDGSIKAFEQKNVNLNYWCHGGRFAGAFIRAAAGNIINVHQGGGMTPVLWVEAKTQKKKK